MPIRPANRDRYPPNWREISRAVRDAAGHRCEFCGVPDGAVGWRDARGRFVALDPLRLAVCQWPRPPFTVTFVAHPPRVIRVFQVVLTVAHLDHTPEHCERANLRAWCQRCHLNYDRAYHVAERARNRAAASGQLSLTGLTI